jgi:hypothetical protein
MWKNEVMVELKTYSKYHIDMWVTEDNALWRKWRFTRFYGDPNRTQRKETWRMLRFLLNESDLPWLCAGDFNEILDHEQLRGNDREEWKMESFREVVQYCSFTNLGYSGAPYTWDKRRENGYNIKVRLDRALANDKMLDLYGGASVTHVQTTESDHCTIKIELRSLGALHGHGHPHSFRYENMWHRHHSYEETVGVLDRQPTKGSTRSR